MTAAQLAHGHLRLRQRRRAHRHDRRGRPPHDLFVQRRRRPDRRDLGRRLAPEKITYTYDADNEMTGAADSFATLTFTYNDDGELHDRRDLGPGLRPADGHAHLQLRPAWRRDQRDRQPVEPGDHDLHLRRRPADDQHHDLVRRHGRPAGRVQLRQRQPADRRSRGKSAAAARRPRSTRRSPTTMPTGS